MHTLSLAFFTGQHFLERFPDQYPQVYLLLEWVMQNYAGGSFQHWAILNLSTSLFKETQ